MVKWIKHPQNKPQLKFDEYKRNFIVYGTPTCGSCGDLKEVLVGRYVKKNQSFEFGEFDCSIDVTHYMEMPESPTEWAENED